MYTKKNLEMSSRTTQQVWDNHGAAFMKRDVDAVLADYSENSVGLLNGKVVKGLDGFKTLFQQLFEKFPLESEFRLQKCVVEGEMVWIEWSADCSKTGWSVEHATDTFFIQDGVITNQTVTFYNLVQKKD
mmetsp:Transcript_8338/g.12680  ORF Transcript_8338/g.12680 Transcript_8338/m.12680 type:complete len:130 (+) Transcript_8338:10-399(+)